MSNLPEMCYILNPSNGALVVVKNGELGYFECDLSTEDKGANHTLMRELNKRLGITPSQLAAMAAGTLFGWNVPAANPEIYQGIFEEELK